MQPSKRCNGKLDQGILTLYNHIDSVDDYTPCYQNELCAIIQLDYEIVLVVI